MKKLNAIFILFVATLFFGEAIGNVASDNLITGLKVNQLDSPANIGDKASFSWMMVSDRKGAATYDVSHLFKKGAGEVNTLSAEVSSGSGISPFRRIPVRSFRFRANATVNTRPGRIA